MQIIENNRKIKVLNVLTGIDDGGLEMLVLRIYNGLNKNLFDLDLCTLIPPKEGFILDGFKRTVRNIYSFKFNNKDLNIKQTFNNFIELIKLIKLIRKEKYDIVHSHEIYSSFVTRITLLIIRILFFWRPKKIYVTYHNVYYWLKPFHRKINKFLSRFTDTIFCVSNSVMTDSINKDKIKNNKYYVIYNGINIETFYPDRNLRNIERNKYAFSEKDFIIGNVGVISERKGQMYLLKAFKPLSEKYDNLKLIFVGTPRIHENKYCIELLDYININKLSEKVKILDTKKDVNSIYNMFDLFVMSSITEGFGLAAFEAMLTERLCIFSDIPTFKELITDKKNGLFFESKNHKSLQTLLEDVYINFDKYIGIAKEGRKYVTETFSVNKMINEYEKKYIFS
ncbi:MAG: glycosyltransferase family 4 protein [Ignavibacteria bacterium]|nr:glycosyltransferase family 4 protein [Ignavibacteria bacterium]